MNHFFKKVLMVIKNNGITGQLGYFFIKHEKLQLSNNYDLDLSHIEPLTQGYTQYLEETQTTSVKRSKYDCYEDNSMYITNCIDEFYGKQLKCYPKMDPDLKQCESKDQTKKTRSLITSSLPRYLGNT